MSPAERPAHHDLPAADLDRAGRTRKAVDFRPYPTAPTRTRRSPAGPARAAARSGMPPTPPTVWFTPDEAAPDAIAHPTPPTHPGRAPSIGEPPAAWPLPVLARTVTAFTEPGATVLLLPWPAEHDHGSAVVPPDVIATVVELDRRPRLESPATPAATRAHPDGTEGRTDLLVAVMPARHDTAGHADAVARLAARELRLGGVLAVLTRCDRRGGELVDPTGPMVTAGQNADLLYLQHVVAVHLPPRHLRDRVVSGSPSRLHRRVHSDVLVFAQPHDVTAHPAAPPPR